MNQIIHVFRKDVRRHWLELSISLVLLAAFAWREPREWKSAFDTDPLSHFLSGVLSVLVPISWSLLIVRIIHGESLVGDRQFWVTRPYEWKKLLAAKILCLLLFINIPFFIVDAILLRLAGFPLASYIPGLLWMQILMTAVLFLPAAALASVTSSISQVLITALAVMLYIVSLGALSSEIPNSNMPSATSVPGLLAFAILMAALLAAFLLQYARRNTWRSRLLLVAGALSILIIMVIAPYSTIIAHAYPPLMPGQEQPVQLTFNSAQTPKPLKQRFPSKEKEVSIQIPLLVFGIAKDSLVVINGTRAAIEATNGARWSSHWQPGGRFLTPERDHDTVGLSIDKHFLERIENSPAKLHVTFALTVFREMNVRNITVTEDDFAVPDVGLCRMIPSRLGSVLCRSPLRRPSYLKASTSSSASPCPPSEDEKPAPAGRVWTAWEWNSDSGPAELGISPVQVVSLHFWDRDDTGNHSSARFCQGTPLTLSTYEQVRQTRAELDISGIKLSDYQLSVP
jgi:hypothetical protein